MNEVKNKIRLAIQSKGRLTNESLMFLESLGLKFPPNNRKLISQCINYNLDILYLRSADIPEYVKRGIADFGIVGKNVIHEKYPEMEKTQELNFGKCKIMIAVSNNSPIKTVKDLEGKTIATSYPTILKNFLQANNTKVSSILYLSGSCEIAPALNIADAICDITQTGKTLEENNLKVLCHVMDSEACLIESPINDSKKNIFFKLCKF